MIRHPRSLPISTSALAGIVVAAGALVVFTSDASAQRSGRGTMSVPRVTTATPPRPSGGTVGRPTRPSALGRGYMATPGGPPRVRGGTPQRGDLPRLVEPRRRGGGYDRGYSVGSHSGRGTRYWRGSSTRWGIGGGCVYGCSGISARIRVGGFAGSFVLGYPLFAVPVVIPYYHHVDVEHYDEAGAEAYASESARPASKLIVIGGGSGGGSDALTVESLGDSVRLSWLANGRQAREVKLFVADSARRELATRSASPSSPTATFEVATLSAPVAFAGVTVVFADGVTSTTLVPYRGDGVPGRPR